jgi:hypothetical protein
MIGSLDGDLCVSRPQLFVISAPFEICIVIQASAVANTWARRCNKIIFFTSETSTDESGKESWVLSGFSGYV